MGTKGFLGGGGGGGGGDSRGDWWELGGFLVGSVGTRLVPGGVWWGTMGSWWGLVETRDFWWCMEGSTGSW